MYTSERLPTRRNLKILLVVDPLGTLTDTTTVRSSIDRHVRFNSGAPLASNLPCASKLDQAFPSAASTRDFLGAWLVPKCAHFRGGSIWKVEIEVRLYKLGLIMRAARARRRATRAAHARLARGSRARDARENDESESGIRDSLILISRIRIGTVPDKVFELKCIEFTTQAPI